MINNIGPGIIANMNATSIRSMESLNVQDAKLDQNAKSANAVEFMDSPTGTAGFSTGDVTGAMFKDPSAFLALYNNDEFNSINQQSAKLSKEDQVKVDTLNKELDQIFGKPKEELTEAEKNKEKELVNAIDGILKKTEPEPLTKVEERQFDAIQKEIDTLFKDGKLTEDEEKKLKALEARMEKLIDSKEPEELSKGDQKQLDELFKKLDELYGVKDPSKAEITRSDEIFAELDKIYSAAQSGDVKDLSSLSKASQEKADKILNEMDKLFQAASTPKLNEKDQKQVDSLNKQIDDLFGVKTLSEAQTKKVDEINRQIEKIFSDDKLSDKEEKTLLKLDKQLEEIFGKPKTLTDADTKKLDTLFEKLDKIYSQQNNQALPKLDYEKLAQLEKALDDLFTNASKDKKAA